MDRIFIWGSPIFVNATMIVGDYDGRCVRGAGRRSEKPGGAAAQLKPSEFPNDFMGKRRGAGRVENDEKRQPATAACTRKLTRGDPETTAPERWGGTVVEINQDDTSNQPPRAELCNLNPNVKPKPLRLGADSTGVRRRDIERRKAQMRGGVKDGFRRLREESANIAAWDAVLMQEVQPLKGMRIIRVARKCWRTDHNAKGNPTGEPY
jgi:hypothetical protein